MQNKEWGINAIRFLVLVLLQVLLFNHINFLGYINPYVYILFIILFPFNGNQTLLLVLSFLLGISIDIFSDSGGIHAAASVLIGYSRPFFLKLAFGVSYLHNTVKLSQARLSQIITYVIAMVFVHHLVLFSLEILTVKQVVLILKSTLFSGIFSAILIISTVLLFSRRK